MFKDGENPIPTWGAGASDEDERTFQPFAQCPPLETPVGADSVRCSGESCAVECKGGYIIQGNPQTKCKKDPQNPGSYMWRRGLGYCVGCDEPVFDDWKVYANCQVNKKNQKICKIGCMQGAKLEGGSHARCKCNRKSGTCGWFAKGNKAMKSFNQTCTGGGPIKYVNVKCSQKPKQCIDVTEKTQVYNAWTCRNCMRIRTEWEMPETFDNRDHMVVTFTEDIQPINFAHPMVDATNPSGDMRTWYITFSDKALFGDRRMDFTSEWRNLGKRAQIASATGCSCKNKIPKN